jgi:hypothetical protein
MRRRVTHNQCFEHIDALLGAVEQFDRELESKPGQVLRLLGIGEQKPCRQPAHPAELRPPQAALGGKDLENSSDPFSPRQTCPYQRRERQISPIDRLP